MNGNYDPKTRGHTFFNTSIKSAKVLQSALVETEALSSTKGAIQVNAPLQVNEDLTINGVTLSNILDRLVKLEAYVVSLDRGLVLQQFDNDGNVTIINYGG